MLTPDEQATVDHLTGDQIDAETDPQRLRKWIEYYRDNGIYATCTRCEHRLRQLTSQDRDTLEEVQRLREKLVAELGVLKATPASAGSSRGTQPPDDVPVRASVRGQTADVKADQSAATAAKKASTQQPRATSGEMDMLTSLLNGSGLFNSGSSGSSSSCSSQASRLVQEVQQLGQSGALPDDLRRKVDANKHMPEAERLIVAGSFKDHGNDKFKAGNYKEALDLYTAALALAPDDSPTGLAARRNRAMMNLKLQQYDAALADCNGVLQHLPHDVKALLRRGEVYRQLKQYEQAHQDFSRVLEVELSNKDAQSKLQELSKLLAAAKPAAPAAAASAPAAAVTEGAAAAGVSRARVPIQIIECEDDSDDDTEFEDVLEPPVIPEMQPTSADDTSTTATAAAEPAAAAASVKASESVSNARQTTSSSSSSSSPSNSSSAVPATKAAAVPSVTPAAAVAEATGAAADRRTSECSSEVSSAALDGASLLEQQVKDYEARGNASFKRGDYQGSIGFYTSAIKLAPDCATLYCNRAQAHLKLERWRVALDDANKAAALDRANYKVYYRRSMAKKGLEDTKGAVADLQHCLSLAPAKSYGTLRKELSELEEYRAARNRAASAAALRRQAQSTRHYDRAHCIVQEVEETPEEVEEKLYREHCISLDALDRQSKRLSELARKRREEAEQQAATEAAAAEAAAASTPAPAAAAAAAAADSAASAAAAGTAAAGPARAASSAVLADTSGSAGATGDAPTHAEQVLQLPDQLFDEAPVALPASQEAAAGAEAAQVAAAHAAPGAASALPTAATSAAASSAAGAAAPSMAAPAEAASEAAPTVEPGASRTASSHPATSTAKAAPPVLTVQQQFAQLKDQGGERFKAHDYAAAEELWHQCLQINPDDAPVLANLSYCYIKQAEQAPEGSKQRSTAAQKALRAADQVLAQTGLKVDVQTRAQFRRGVALELLARWEDAMHVLMPLVEAGLPNAAEALQRVEQGFSRQREADARLKAAEQQAAAKQAAAAAAAASAPPTAAPAADAPAALDADGSAASRTSSSASTATQQAGTKQDSSALVQGQQQQRQDSPPTAGASRANSSDGNRRRMAVVVVDESDDDEDDASGSSSPAQPPSADSNSSVKCAAAPSVQGNAPQDRHSAPQDSINEQQAAPAPMNGKPSSTQQQQEQRGSGSAADAQGTLQSDGAAVTKACGVASSTAAAATAAATAGCGGGRSAASKAAATKSGPSTAAESPAAAVTQPPSSGSSKGGNKGGNITQVMGSMLKELGHDTKQQQTQQQQLQLPPECTVATQGVSTRYGKSIAVAQDAFKTVSEQKHAMEEKRMQQIVADMKKAPANSPDEQQSIFRAAIEKQNKREMNAHESAAKARRMVPERGTTLRSVLAITNSVKQEDPLCAEAYLAECMVYMKFKRWANALVAINHAIALQLSCYFAQHSVSHKDVPEGARLEQMLELRVGAQKELRMYMDALRDVKLLAAAQPFNKQWPKLQEELMDLARQQLLWTKEHDSSSAAGQAAPSSSDRAKQGQATSASAAAEAAPGDMHTNGMGPAADGATANGRTAAAGATAAAGSQASRKGAAAKAKQAGAKQGQVAVVGLRVQQMHVDDTDGSDSSDFEGDSNHPNPRDILLH